MGVNNFSIGDAGLNLIKSFENCILSPYLDSNNIPTIGWGCTYYCDNSRVSMDDPPITQDQADQMLICNLQTPVDFINEVIQITLTQNQFDALCCFVYNVGSGNFKKSTLLEDINNNNLADVPTQFLRWDKAGGKVLPGLLRRRQAEIDLWNS